MMPQKGGYYMGKAHFCAHADLEEVFITSWVGHKNNPSPNVIGKKKRTVHDAIANFRRRTAKDFHKVKMKTVVRLC